MSWFDRAACLNVPSSFFFVSGENHRREENIVRKTCAPCPVKTECVQACDVEEHYTTNRHSIFGFRGGETPIARANRRGKTLLLTKEKTA